MKQLIFVLVLMMGTILISNTSNAKPKKAQLGYWVVQDYVDGKGDAMVRFYNTSDSLVYEQNLGKKQVQLNKKNIRRLNKELKNYRRSQLKKEKFMITKL